MKRNYICECTNEKCRDTFQMTVKEYRRITLSNGRIVMRGHGNAGDKIRAVGDNIIVIEGEIWPQVKM